LKIKWQNQEVSRKSEEKWERGALSAYFQFVFFSFSWFILFPIITWQTWILCSLSDTIQISTQEILELSSIYSLSISKTKLPRCFHDFLSRLQRNNVIPRCLSYWTSVSI
jgi:hypothetical protein